MKWYGGVLSHSHAPALHVHLTPISSAPFIYENQGAKKEGLKRRRAGVKVQNRLPSHRLTNRI